MINNTFLYFTPPFLGENSNFNISKTSFCMEREMSGNDTIRSTLVLLTPRCKGHPDKTESC